MKRYDVVYAVSVTKWVVVRGVEVEDHEDTRHAEAKVRANPPMLTNCLEHTTTRTVGYPEGHRLAYAKQTNAGPVFDDGEGI